MFELHGVDVYIQSNTLPDVPKEHGGLKLIFISNRGTRVWPGPEPDLRIMDLFRCRYESESIVNAKEIDALLNELTEMNLVWPNMQKLFWSNGERQYSQPY